MTAGIFLLVMFIVLFVRVEMQDEEIKRLRDNQPFGQGPGEGATIFVEGIHCVKCKREFEVGEFTWKPSPENDLYRCLSLTNCRDLRNARAYYNDLAALLRKT